jgi:hypothetical protein
VDADSATERGEASAASRRQSAVAGALTVAALVATSLGWPIGLHAAEATVCEPSEIEYALAARLQVRGTVMGAGDGTYPVGPGRLVLRFERQGSQRNAYLVAYELAQRFVVSPQAVFWKGSVTTDVVTRGSATTGAAIAYGVLEANVIRWNGPTRTLRSDGTVACSGSLCGKFGAPASGQSEVHMSLTVARLEPFTLSADRATYTMPYALMSKTAAPRQDSRVTIAGRALRRVCVAGR